MKPSGQDVSLGKRSQTRVVCRSCCGPVGCAASHRTQTVCAGLLLCVLTNSGTKLHPSKCKGVVEAGGIALRLAGCMESGCVVCPARSPRAFLLAGPCAERRRGKAGFGFELCSKIKVLGACGEV